MHLCHPQSSSRSLITICSLLCIMGRPQPGHVDAINRQPLRTNCLQISSGGKLHCLADAGYRLVKDHLKVCVSRLLDHRIPHVVYPRMTLLVLLILSRNGLFMVEQPMQTLLQWHRRWQWLCNRVCFVTCMA